MKDPRAFGKQLKRVLASKAAYKILDADTDVRGSTWTSGGCLAAAKALHLWLHRRGENVRLNAIWGSSRADEAGEEVQQHVVVWLRDSKRGLDMYFDADGLSTERRLLERWEGIERVRDARLDMFVEEYAGDLVCPARVVTQLQRLFDKELVKAAQ